MDGTRSTTQARNQWARIVVWCALLGCLPAVLCAQGVGDYGEPELRTGNLGWWFLGLVVGIMVRSTWYWLGSRLFRCKPLFGNCVIAAILPEILVFLLSILVGIIVGIFACINIYLGVLILIVALIYLLVMYIKWVNSILELESMPVAIFLVLLPFLVNVLFALGEQ